MRIETTSGRLYDIEVIIRKAGKKEPLVSHQIEDEEYRQLMYALKDLCQDSLTFQIKKVI